jgi:hypothetical protein
LEADDAMDLARHCCIGGDSAQAARLPP